MNLFMILKIVTIFKSSREYTVKMVSQSTQASTYEKLLKTKVQVGSKEICNIAIKDRVVAMQDREIRCT